MSGCFALTRVLEKQDGMEVIWHDHPGIQADREVVRQSQPARFKDITRGVEVLLPVDDLPKSVLALPGDQGNEVCSGSGVIIIFQAN